MKKTVIFSLLLFALMYIHSCTSKKGTCNNCGSDAKLLTTIVPCSVNAAGNPNNIHARACSSSISNWLTMGGDLTVGGTASIAGTVTAPNFVGAWNGYPDITSAVAGIGVNPSLYIKYTDTTALIPTKAFVAANYYTKTVSDARFLQSFTELDPTVPAYSKTLSAFSVIKAATDPLYRPISYVPSFSDITSKPTTLSGYGITDAQGQLFSGTNIKTINGTSVLGSGNIVTGSGTVTSVGLSAPSAFTIYGSPVTSSGTLTLTGAGTSSQVIDGTGALKNLTPFAGYGTGTPYALTTSSAAIDLGTSDPTITITSPGTYLITSNVQLEYAGLTTVLNTCSFKLRRTNNTPADLANASTNFTVPALTLASQTGGDADLNAIIYTTSNSNDKIDIFGNRSGGLTLGSIQISNAYIVATKLY